MNTKIDVLILDGVEVPDLPSGFTQLNMEYGTREQSFIAINGRRLVVHSSANTTELKPQGYKRKNQRQAWKFQWTGTEAIVTEPMSTILRELYESQRGFWVQFDNEMMRSWARCLSIGFDILRPELDHAYFTPTFPIFPYGWEPGDDPDDFSGCIMVNNRLYTGDYTVDRELGLLTISGSSKLFTDRTKVLMKYTWIAYVRVQMLDIQPISIAQTYSSAELVLEQIAIPEDALPSYRDAYPDPVCITFRDRYVEGGFNFLGSATPGRIRHGSASGTITFDGSANGETSSDNSALGELAFSGAISGVRERHVDASGSLEFMGTATGMITTTVVPEDEVGGG